MNAAFQRISVFIPFTVLLLYPPAAASGTKDDEPVEFELEEEEEEEEEKKALEIDEVEVIEDAPNKPMDDERFSLSPVTSEKLGDATGVHVTTEEVLESTPSLRVRKFGSYGSPSFLSIRGSDAAHTLVMLDDIPLNDASTGLVDLSTIPSFLLEDVSVFRGFVASAPSPFSPGGVVKFTSKKPKPGVHGEAGLQLGVYPLRAGSGKGEDADLAFKNASSFFRFGALRKILLSASTFNHRIGFLASGSLENGDGDFAYFSDNGTVYNLTDDSYQDRANNDHTTISALFTLLYLPDAWSEVRVSFLEFDRDSGVPGLDVLQATKTRLRSGRQYLSLSYSRFKEFYNFPSLRAKGYFKSSSTQWLDPGGEISNARQDSRNSSLGGGVGLSGCKLIGSAGTLLWGANGGVERWDGESRYYSGEISGREALRLSVGANATYFVSAAGGIVDLLGALRADFIGDKPLSDPDDDPDGRSVNEYFLSPGGGIKINPFSWVSLSINVSYNHRPASLIELYGNQGVIVGNADLRSERSVSTDLGVAFDFSSLAGVEEFKIEYHFFDNRISDLIVFIQNSQKTMVARNIGKAEIRGAELTLSAKLFSLLGLKLGYTFLDPRDRSGIEPYDGRTLPNRPRHDIFLKASVSRWSVTLSYKLDYLFGGYIDRASLLPIAERDIHSLSVAWDPDFLKGFTMGFELWNLGNLIVIERGITAGERHYTIKEAISDVEGYPLPGFGIYFTAGFKK